MLRKIVVGWLCLLGAVVAAIGVTIQAAIARLRDRIRGEHADDPAAADETPAD